MIVLSNLFSIFDPSCSYFNLSWLTIFSPVMVMLWSMSSKFSNANKSMLMSISSEFNQTPKNMKPIEPKLFISVFLIILLFNLVGMAPLSFTTTAQIAISVPLAMSLMLSIWLHQCVFNPKMMLAHLCPIGSPMGLAPILTLIELVSLMIRPLTLSIRLTANMMAGHLLLSLIFSAMSTSNLAITIFLSIALLSLELAVSLIQAYVFSILILLYKSEI